MLFVASAIHQRDRPASGELAQVVKLLRVPAQLRAIAPLEIAPAGGVVPKLFPQLGAGRDLLEPVIDPGFLLPQAPRP
jgi:hypothetical protein